jgi:hypothetical protein
VNLTLGGTKVKNVAVLLEHVDLLDAGDGLDTKLLEGSLELAVVTLGSGHRLLDLLTAGSALAACRVKVYDGIRGGWR